ncbi:hypothetical protein [Knoellia sp. p5-6-4]|uniref:hypothetical protein n=1 Tax=unclassified Knoellia TaxID=2618719 RepID=UPI0023DB9016|nr:hypothetical protein [Knoellia sp. p5-6-4]MDF2143530.1 hypothetical protein [Knoellia sp. p5-6-4]
MKGKQTVTPWRPRPAQAAALVLSAVVVTGCTRPSASREQPTPPVDCIPAGGSAGDALLRAKPGPVEDTTRSRAVRLPDPEPIYLVAPQFRVRGIDQQLMGVWAESSLGEEGGDFLAVDETAQRFTDWPHADKSSTHISPSDPAVAQTRFCADGELSHLEKAPGTVAR